MQKSHGKTYISYSWSSTEHCDYILSLAKRLMDDGVDVIFDKWDLSEGQDKFAFMEKMVSDSDVTKVIIFSDRKYAEKANNRTAGVGTESQIISKEVYEKVDQKKFIPVVCEKDEKGEPYLPVFLSSRIYIDFSSPDRVQENWEYLIRALFDKPFHKKPQIGKPPSYLNENHEQTDLPTIRKLENLKNALLNSRPTVKSCREDFFLTVIDYVNILRVREPIIESDKLEEKVTTNLKNLLSIRDHIIEWIFIEAQMKNSNNLGEIVISFLEKLLPLKYRPEELEGYNEAWFDSHAIFIYELFLYIIATLIKLDHYDTIQELLTTDYLFPGSAVYLNRRFARFDSFWTVSKVIEYRNLRQKLHQIDPLAYEIRERATRSDILFEDIMQAELIIFLMSIISNDITWYPHTLTFAVRELPIFPIFHRAKKHKYFIRLSQITKISSAKDLRNKFIDGCERNQVHQWSDFHSPLESFLSLLNMDLLDTVR